MNPLVGEKKKLEEAIVKNMIMALESDKITEGEMSTISGVVLDGIDAAETHEALQKFLEDLAARWKIFSPLVVLEKAVMQEKVEDEVAKGVLILLEHGKIENAIKLAQSVTHTHNQSQ